MTTPNDPQAQALAGATYYPNAVPAAEPVIAGKQSSWKKTLITVVATATVTAAVTATVTGLAVWGGLKHDTDEQLDAAYEECQEEVSQKVGSNQLAFSDIREEGSWVIGEFEANGSDYSSSVRALGQGEDPVSAGSISAHVSDAYQHKRNFMCSLYLYEDGWKVYDINFY